MAARVGSRASPPVDAPERQRSALVFVFVTVFVDTVGLGIVIPVLPELISRLAGVDLARGASWAGALAFVFAAMQFVCAPIVGSLSDRFGRRPVLLGSLFAFGCDYLLTSLAPSIGWLFLGRAVAGAAGASYSAAAAFVADVTPPERRAQGFGLIGAAFGAGFVLGPAIGGLLGGYGTRVPFLVAAGAAFANLAFGALALPESLPRAARRPLSLARANPVGSLRELARHRAAAGLAAAAFLWLVAHQVLPSVWSFSTLLRFAWSERQVGASLAFAGLIMVTSQGFLTRALIPRLGGERRAALAGFSAALAGYLVFALAREGWQMYAGLSAWLLAGLAYPSLNALLSRRVPANAQGELQGALASLQGVSAILGPPLMTQLFARFSAAGASPRFPGAPFAAAALLAVAGLALLAAATADRAAPDAAA
jgi:DHA1 family tetracycline resistance protein-like MFS transporter